MDQVDSCTLCDTPMESVVKNYLGCQMLLEDDTEPAPVSRTDLTTSYPSFAQTMIELYEYVSENSQCIMQWDSIVLPHNLSNEDKAHYNRIMHMAQEGAFRGASTNDFMALGLPPFLMYPIDSLRKKVDLCMQLRKSRPWTRNMNVYIYQPV